MDNVGNSNKVKSHKTMGKKEITLTYDQIIIFSIAVLIGIFIGFWFGVVYKDHSYNQAYNPPSTGICNCPMQRSLPSSTTPNLYCRCQ